MITVKEILSKKNKKNISVEFSIPVVEALQVMADNNIGAVLVVDNDEYKGIFTERDYSRKIVLQGKNSSDTKVGDVLSEHFPQVHPDSILEECILLMADNNIRYLPVFESDKLAGVISIGDVVNTIMAYQKETINHLKDYIAM